MFKIALHMGFILRHNNVLELELDNCIMYKSVMSLFINYGLFLRDHYIDYKMITL